ncbi:hypothetical protein SGLAM104S_06287 [Streptomyces glaucescens]
MVHQAAVDAEFGQMAYVDAVELLDPADAAADHAEQPLRLLPLPSRAVRAAEHADAGGETVGGADRLVQFHQTARDGREAAVLALHLVQPAAQLAGEDVDAVADADDGLFGGGGAVELLLDADQRGAQDLAEVGLEFGCDLGALVHRGQQVVDGVTGAQPPQRLGQLLIGEAGDRLPLVRELFLPEAGLLGEPRLVTLGLLGQPRLVALGLSGEPRLVTLGLLGEPGLVGLGLLGEPGLVGGALGGVPALQTGHVLLPLLGVLGLSGAEPALGPAQLGLGAQQQPYADRPGRRRRGSGDGRGYSLRAHERGGNRPAS